MQTIFDSINGCIKEYGIKINVKRQKWFIIIVFILSPISNVYTDTSSVDL